MANIHAEQRHFADYFVQELQAYISAKQDPRLYRLLDEDFYSDQVRRLLGTHKIRLVHKWNGDLETIARNAPEMIKLLMLFVAYQEHYVQHVEVVLNQYPNVDGGNVNLDMAPVNEAVQS